MQTTRYRTYQIQGISRLLGTELTKYKEYAEY